MDVELGYKDPKTRQQQLFPLELQIESKSKNQITSFSFKEEVFSFQRWVVVSQKLHNPNITTFSSRWVRSFCGTRTSAFASHDR